MTEVSEMEKLLVEATPGPWSARMMEVGAEQIELAAQQARAALKQEPKP